MALGVDETLIGIFLSFSIVFIVIWAVLLLKWRKKYLNTIFPCFRFTRPDPYKKSQKEIDKKKASKDMTVSTVSKPNLGYNLAYEQPNRSSEQDTAKKRDISDEFSIIPNADGTPHTVESSVRNHYQPESHPPQTSSSDHTSYHAQQIVPKGDENSFSGKQQSSNDSSQLEYILYEDIIKL